jgi:GH25 family lysozyme M1 (1,4-beta-N-acetylmuramidase)
MHARVGIGIVAVVGAVVASALASGVSFADTTTSPTTTASSSTTATASPSTASPSTASTAAPSTATVPDSTGQSAADSAADSDPSLAQQDAAGNHAMGSTVPENDSTASGGSTLQLHSFAAAAATGPSSAYAKGFDISAYQPNSGINWSSAAANGAKFVYMKATEGTTYTSSQFGAQWASAGSAGLKRGAYVFAKPANATGVATANYFYAHGGTWANDGKTLPPLLDIEYGTTQGTCYGLSQSAMVSWISSFVNQMRKLTGRWPAIYTTTDWWSTCTGNNSGFANDPFMVAHYTSAATPGTLGASWSSWTMWQWADAGTFPGDQDVFNGNTTTLAKYVASGTAPASTAKGSIDSMTATYGALTVVGWAADTTTSASTKVDIDVDGTPHVMTASGSRPDVAKVYPSLGAAHGYSTTMNLAAGAHSVCVLAYSANGITTATLGCQTVSVPSANPHGSLDSAVGQTNAAKVTGWAIDPETSAAITVQLLVDGKVQKAFVANASRPDIARAYPSAGAAHGFSTKLSMGPGTHTVCLRGVNVGRGSSVTIGCKSVRVAGSAPVGSFDTAKTGPKSVTFTGWALDGDTAASIPVRVTIDGKAHQVTANGNRPDIARVFPAYGAAHGFSAVHSLGLGKHTICATAMNVASGSTNTSLGCKTVTVTNAAPIGSLDTVTGGKGSIAVQGWSIDPNTVAAIAVHVYVDKAGHVLAANQARPDVGRVYPDYGANHGYSATFAANPGTYTVCAYGIDSTGGANTKLACKAVKVS